VARLAVNMVELPLYSSNNKQVSLIEVSTSSRQAVRPSQSAKP